jgi:hypothetical protein
MALSHAQIRNKSGKKTPDDIEVKINPTELSISRGATYQDMPVPGLSVPLLQFIRGEAQTLTCELFLDASDKRDVSAPNGDSVRKRLDDLRAYVNLLADLHAPPVCQFLWGDVDFTGVITSLQERFVLFDETGKILRARVNVSIKSYVPVETQAQTTKPNSPDRYKTRVVKEGDRIDLIAADEYGDPRLWRPIAEFNRLARPLFLRPGTVLSIPPL